MPAPCSGRERPIADSVPEFARIRDTMARYGMSRSAIYREAALGNIRLVKLGHATLVDLASIRAFMARLPAATLRAPKTST
jgi:predicted DNA-binding transcriptional regulator AlpA